MSMQTGSTRGHHLANYHCWRIGADPNRHRKHITPCPKMPGNMSACHSTCHTARRGRAAGCGRRTTGDSGVTKPPGQRHRQDGGCQATCSLHFFFFGGLSMSGRPSPRPTLTDGWLLHPGGDGGEGLSGRSISPGGQQRRGGISLQPTQGKKKEKKQTAGNRSR